jgi:hypothetical protein
MSIIRVTTRFFPTLYCSQATAGRPSEDVALKAGEFKMDPGVNFEMMGFE